MIMSKDYFEAVAEGLRRAKEVMRKLKKGEVEAVLLLPVTRVKSYITFKQGVGFLLIEEEPNGNCRVSKISFYKAKEWLMIHFLIPPYLEETRKPACMEG